MANSGIPDGTAARRGPWAAVLRDDSAGRAVPDLAAGSSFPPSIVTRSGTVSPPRTYLENGPEGLVWTFKFFDGGGYAPRACP